MRRKILDLTYYLTVSSAKYFLLGKAICEVIENKGVSKEAIIYGGLAALIDAAHHLQIRNDLTSRVDQLEKKL